MWRLLYAIPSWLIFIFVIDLPLIILGWIVVPIAAACGAYDWKLEPNDDNVSFKKTSHFTWKFMWLWDNFEDGISNATYWQAPNKFLQIVYWSCLRNPVNNLRLVPYLKVQIEPLKVRFIGAFCSATNAQQVRWAQEHIGRTILDHYDTPIPQWFFAWQGIYSCWYWQFNLFGKLRRFWVGWKIYPTDIFGVTEYRRKGAGFALQWKVVS